MSPPEREAVLSITMALSPRSTIVATPHQVGAEMGQDVILLHLTNGLYFGLDHVGARIWQLLQVPITLEDMEQVLLQEYDVDPDRCHIEVVQLVEELLAQGLVEVREP